MSTIHPGLEAAIAGSDLDQGRDRVEFLAALDERPFQDKFVKQLPHGLRSIELITEGMNCTSCVRKLEGLNSRVTGLVELRANLGRSLIRITWDPEQTQLSSIVRDVESLGYVTHPHRVEKGEKVRRR